MHGCAGGGVGVQGRTWPQRVHLLLAAAQYLKAVSACGSSGGSSYKQIRSAARGLEDTCKRNHNTAAGTFTDVSLRFCFDASDRVPSLTDEVKLHERRRGF